MDGSGTRLANGQLDGYVHSTAGETHHILKKVLAAENRRIFSGIYQHLLALVGPGSSKTVLVCSANSEEGTTSIAVGLAVAAAEKCAGPVLLIDGNIHHPEVCQVFGAADNSGLGNLPARNGKPRVLSQPTTVYGSGNAAHLTSPILPSLRQRPRRRGPSNLSFFGSPATLFRAPGT